MNIGVANKQVKEMSIRALDSATHEALLSGLYVPESRFGVWFLGTEIWSKHVLKRAIEDLDRLIENRHSSYPVIVDVGCGFGRSFKMLSDRFRPAQMVGIDLDPKMLAGSVREAKRQGLHGRVQMRVGFISSPSRSIRRFGVLPPNISSSCRATQSPWRISSGTQARRRVAVCRVDQQVHPFLDHSPTLSSSNAMCNGQRLNISA